METSYAAWRLHTPVPYTIVAVTKARVAELPMPDWVGVLEPPSRAQARSNTR